MKPQADNFDAAEVSKFDQLARKWWDPESEFKSLHDINPLRVGYITGRVDVNGKRVLDVGCGGGLLTEALARAGASVVGIDMAKKSLQVAKLHAYESGLEDEVEYHTITAEAFAEEHAGEFDLVTCLELLEHVPSPASVISACHTLLKPGGHFIMSSVNRNPKAYALMVLGAEYILGLLPRGTHDYAKFIKPAELARDLRDAGFALTDLTGLVYNPITRHYRLSRDTDVNYLAHAIAH